MEEQNITKTKRGMLELILGSMYSGKSTELIRRATRCSIANKNCIVIKSKMDDRYSSSEQINTHDGRTYPSVICDKLMTLNGTFHNIDVICIDEAQFFDDLVEFCLKMTELGKRVIVAGLQGDYHRHNFGHMSELMSYASKIDLLTAVCMICGSDDATFSRRVIPNETNNLIRVGGKETYIAVCANCWKDSK